MSTIPVGMRRSARQSTQATFFSPFKEELKHQASRASQVTSDSDSGDDNDGSSSSNAAPRRRIAQTKKQPAKSAIAEVSSPESESQGRNSPPIRQRADPKSSNTLFNLLKKPKIVDKDIDHWISVFKSDRVGAMADLVNYVLMCAGAEKVWVRRDVDLEALEAEELDEMLAGMIQTMHRTDYSQRYPVSSHTKESKKQRERFTEFWMHLTYRILSKDDSQSGGGGIKSSDILRIIVDQLVSLSSMIVLNVRDVVTEASFAIGRQASATLVELRQKIQIADRQLSAEKGKDQKASKKFLAIQKEKSVSDKLLSSLTQLVENIFNSIFIHRHKDSQENVRALCADKLGEWICSDAEYFYKDEYLKYVGWLCSDAKSEVRRAALSSLRKVVDHNGSSEALASFVEHFMGRFIEIAFGDLDEECSVSMISALRVMQNNGLVDFVPETQLDRIDMIVFDIDAKLQSRQEALEFMMEHTLGFQDDEEEDEDLALQPKKKAPKTSSTSSSSITMANRKKMSVRLETLAEFVEHHVGNEISVPSEIFCETCLSIDKVREWLRDWSTMISLLLREGDEFTSSSLNDTQCAVLLRMLSHSAKSLQTSITSKPSKKQQGKIKEQVTRTQDEQDWDALSEQLIKSLPRLLVRFRDDEENLFVLADLLPCCDISSGSLHQKSMKLILGTISNLLATSYNDSLVEKLCISLRDWMNLGGNAKTQVEAAVRELLSSSLQKINDTHSVITSLKSNSTKAKSSSKKSSGSQDKDLDDALFGLSSSVSLLKNLSRNLDCRDLTTVSTSEISDKLVNAADFLLDHCERLSAEGIKSKPLLRSCISGLQNCGNCIFNYMLWSFRDVMHEVRNLKEGDEPPAGIMDILELREKVVDIVHTWLSLGSSEENLDVDFRRSAQFTAFEIVGDMRVIFSARLKEARFLDSLAWSPSKEFLDDLRMVFETEEKRICEDLEALPEIVEAENELSGANVATNKKNAQMLSRQLVDCLLQPLSHIMIYDTENINRRQAAAIFMHIQSPFERIKTFVKNIFKRLKTQDIVKLLEIQLVTLKMHYENHVLRTVSQYEGDDEVDEEEAIREIATQLSNVVELSKTFSTSMFVGKAKGESLAALGKLFILGMEFAFSEGVSTNITFLRALSPFVKLLEKSHLRTICEYFENHISDLNIDLDDDDAVEDKYILGDVLQSMRDFHLMLQGGKPLPSKSRRKQTSPPSNLSVITQVPSGLRGVKSLNELDYEATHEDSQVKFEGVKKKSKRPPSRSKSRSRQKRKVMSDDDNDDDDDDDEEEEEGDVEEEEEEIITKKAKVRAASSTITSNKIPIGLHLEEIKESDDYDSEDEEGGGTAAVKARASTGSRGSKRSTGPSVVDSDSDDDIATWGRGSLRRNRR